VLSSVSFADKDIRGGVALIHSTHFLDGAFRALPKQDRFKWCTTLGGLTILQHSDRREGSAEPLRAVCTHPENLPLASSCFVHS
jgi:hypothetical protein